MNTQRRLLKKWWQSKGAHSIFFYILASWGRPATYWPMSQSTSWGCLWLLVTGKDQSQCCFMQSLSCAKVYPPYPSSPAVCEVIFHASETRQTLCFVTACMVIFLQHCSFSLQRLTGGCSSSTFTLNVKICFLFPVRVFDIKQMRMFY